MAGSPAFAQGRPQILAPRQLPPAPLAEALRAVAIATGTTIAFAPETVAGRRARAVTLSGDASAIVRRLLAGSSLAVERTGPRSLLVLPQPTVPLAHNTPSAALPALAAGDIMVTALRRPTLLTDTPISLVAVRGEDLMHDQATSLEGLARLAPSLTVTSSGPGFNRLTMRGAYAAGEATVALYYGNVPVAGPGGSTSDPGLMTPDLVLADVDRVEVLRGPQGTLYGTSSLAGTVRVLFNGPQLDQRTLGLDSSASTTRSGAASASVTAAMNLPLVPGQIALRAVGWHEYTGGVVDFPRLGRSNTDDQVREGGRLALRWQLAPDWRADLTGVWQRSRIGNTHSTTAGALPNQSQGQVIVPFFDTFAMAALDLHGKLAGVSLDATLARSWWRPHRFWDFTQSQLNHLGDGTACAAWAGIGTSSCSATQMAGFNRYLLANSPTLVAQPGGGYHQRGTAPLGRRDLDLDSRTVRQPAHGCRAERQPGRERCHRPGASRNRRRIRPPFRQPAFRICAVRRWQPARAAVADGVERLALFPLCAGHAKRGHPGQSVHRAVRPIGIQPGLSRAGVGRPCAGRGAAYRRAAGLYPSGQRLPPWRDQRGAGPAR
jgi:hypothetical protein